MIRVYHPFWEWEDYNAGMWQKIEHDDESELFEKIITFTSDHKKYGEAMLEVIDSWPKTMEHNLTNPSLNHRAFIGHCACCYKFGWPEYLVRKAWKHLSIKQQELANKKANEAIKLWRQKKNRHIRNHLGEQMLF